jgi:uncharacterized protein (DUF1015 family)
MPVTIKPFSALRFQPQAGDLNDLICPPYDKISPEQKTQLWNKSEHNAVRITLPGDNDPVDWYPQAAQRCMQWQEQNILALDNAPAFYIYEVEYKVENAVYHRKGFLAIQSLPEEGSADVKPHENTFEGPKADRLRLMRATQMATSPIFLLYRDPQTATLPLLTPQKWDSQAVDQFGNTHRMSALTDPKAQAQLQEALARSEVMIADGHHRFATAQNYRKEQREKLGDMPDAPWNFNLVYLVPVEDPGLSVLPTHRLLSLGGIPDASALISKIQEVFDVKTVHSGYPTPTKKGELGFILKNEKYILTLRDEVKMTSMLPQGTSSAYAGLDVVLLHTGLFSQCLGVNPDNYADKLSFAKTAKEATNKVENSSVDLAVLLHSTSVDEVMEVAAEGEKMPQKSTDFYPKVLTGMVFYPHS